MAWVEFVCVCGLHREGEEASPNGGAYTGREGLSHVPQNE